MSQETSQWLNNNTLIGFTAERGHAWHYREEDQGNEANHYVGAIPIEDVRRRLFHWEAIEEALPPVPVAVLNSDGVDRYEVTDPNRKVVIRPRGALGQQDPGGILGVFTQNYQIHQFNQWLLENVATLIDDDLQIGSAGLLQMGGVAFVQIEFPETMHAAGGIEFRPHLLAATSMNGTLSTSYKRCVTLAVCDNTMEAALVEGGGRDSGGLRIRHSAKSLNRLTEVREALDIVHSVGEEFQAQVDQLLNTKVSDGDWAKFLDEIAPLPDQSKNPYGYSVAEKKRDAINSIYIDDERAGNWTGTAWGVLQTINTYNHHGTQVQGEAPRYERNMMQAIKGRMQKEDTDALKALTKVLA
jgi:phage/plasmid-like protein (TIGR03299 family)